MVTCKLSVCVNPSHETRNSKSVTEIGVRHEEAHAAHRHSAVVDAASPPQLISAIPARPLRNPFEALALRDVRQAAEAVLALAVGGGAAAAAAEGGWVRKVLGVAGGGGHGRLVLEDGALAGTPAVSAGRRRRRGAEPRRAGANAPAAPEAAPAAAGAAVAGSTALGAERARLPRVVEVALGRVLVLDLGGRQPHGHARAREVRATRVERRRARFAVVPDLACHS